MGMHNPAHPGEILRKLVLAPLGLSVTDAADHLGVSRKTLSKVLNAYDLWQARQHSRMIHVSPITAHAV
jgi:plasmid maintenance system antidote protein VapI